jgi:hypothetical protein
MRGACSGRRLAALRSIGALLIGASLAAFAQGGCTSDFDALFGACPPGREDCNGNPGDGCEIDLATDSANCGACGVGCEGGPCQLGSCGAGGAGGIGGAAGVGGASGSAGIGGSGGTVDAPADALDAGTLYQQTVLSDDPLVYFRLGEQPTADGGTPVAQNLGTAPLVGHYDASPELGVPGAISGDSDTAVRFSGSGRRLRVDDPGALLAFGTKQPFTVEAWVKQDSMPPDAGVSHFHFISRYDPGLPTNQQVGYTAYLNLLAPGSATFVFLRKQLNLVEGRAMSGGHDPTAWNHIVGVFDGSGVTLYVNHTSVDVDSADFDLPSSVLPLSVGNTKPGSAPFEGVVDEVAIYDHALPAARVQAHFEVGSGTN